MADPVLDDVKIKTPVLPEKYELQARAVLSAKLMLLRPALAHTTALELAQKVEKWELFLKEIKALRAKGASIGIKYERTSNNAAVGLPDDDDDVPTGVSRTDRILSQLRLKPIGPAVKLPVYQAPADQDKQFIEDVEMVLELAKDVKDLFNKHQRIVEKAVNACEKKPMVQGALRNPTPSLLAKYGTFEEVTGYLGKLMISEERMLAKAEEYKIQKKPIRKALKKSDSIFRGRFGSSITYRFRDVTDDLEGVTAVKFRGERVRQAMKDLIRELESGRSGIVPAALIKALKHPHETMQYLGIASEDFPY